MTLMPSDFNYMDGIVVSEATFCLKNSDAQDKKVSLTVRTQTGFLELGIRSCYL